MNIFERDKANWEEWVSSLLWHQVIYHKNDFSGYELMVEPNQYTHCKKGDIVGNTMILSYSIGQTRRLTWKELALVLGFWKDALLPDYHKCDDCPLVDKCTAYFKWDEDHERCNGWMEKCADKVPDLDEEYQKFIDRMMRPFPKAFTPLPKEEAEKILKQIEDLEK